MKLRQEVSGELCSLHFRGYGTMDFVGAWKVLMKVEVGNARRSYPEAVVRVPYLQLTRVHKAQCY